jgi:hypothetical protein
MDTFISLHKYFIWANRFRDLFEKELARQPISESDATTFYIQDSVIFMSYWYAGLYVVVEGYLELEFHDKIVDQLLKSPHVGLLKRYRNGVFHFQKKYFDARFEDFISAQDIVPWVRALNKEIGRFFLAELRRRRKQPKKNRIV